MKQYGLMLWICLLGWSGATAQNKQLLYDFTETPEALLLNPGSFTDFEWYVGVPVLSGISLQAGSNALTVHDLFADDGVDINQKIRERAIYGMDTRDELSGSFQISLLQGGYRGRNPNNFYSFGIYAQGDAIGYWFKDYAILAYEGNADQLGRKFDLGHLKTRGEMVNVFHFGLNKRVHRDLIMGVRAKLYSSVFNFKSTQNRGYFVTNEGTHNRFAHTIDADLEMHTSGVEGIREAIEDDRSQLPGIVGKRMFFGGDLGVGVDLGLTHYLTRRTVVTASVLDLGFVYSHTDIKNYTIKGTATVEGVEVILPEAFPGMGRDYWQDLVDEVDALVPHGTNGKSYLHFRPTQLYASLRYNFGRPLRSRLPDDCRDYVRWGKGNREYSSAVGGQLYMINRPRGPQAALTAFYSHRLGNALAFKTTYTVDKFSYSNIGLGMSLQAGPVNFYLMADNILAYNNIADSHYSSFQLGLNIISWGKN